MPRRRRATSNDPEGARSRILKAAEEVFAEKGYNGARVAEIADRAGMDKRLIFYYFDTKKGLYSHILEDFFQRAAPRFDDFLRHRKDLSSTIDLVPFLVNMTDFIQQNWNHVRILFREFLDGGLLLEDLMEDRVLPIVELWRAYYPRFFPHRKGSRREADHMLLTLSGMCLFYFLVVPLMERVWGEDPLHPNRLTERKAFLKRRVQELVR